MSISSLSVFDHCIRRLSNKYYLALLFWNIGFNCTSKDCKFQFHRIICIILYLFHMMVLKLICIIVFSYNSSIHKQNHQESKTELWIPLSCRHSHLYTYTRMHLPEAIGSKSQPTVSRLTKCPSCMSEKMISKPFLLYRRKSLKCIWTYTYRCMKPI